MLRKIFNMYSIEKNGNKVLTFRQMTAFLKDFNFFELTCFKKIDVITLELIFKKRVPKKLCSFKEFIEVLFKLCKNEENLRKCAKAEEAFKKMMDKMLLPKYKELSIKAFEFNLNRIQVFYQQYDDHDNPIVLLLYQSDEFLKHVYFLFILRKKNKIRSFLCMKTRTSNYQLIAL